MPQSAATSLRSVPDGVRAFDEARHVRFARGPWRPASPATSGAWPRPATACRRRRSISLDLLAGHQQAHVILGQQHAARVLEHGRLVLAHPDELGRGEARHGDVAGDLARARLGLLERGALLFAAAVVPEDGGAQRLVGGVEQRGAVHLAGEAHGLALPCAASAGSALTAALVALHQSAGFCSDHPAADGKR